MKKYIIFAGVNGAGKSTLYHLEVKIYDNTVSLVRIADFSDGNALFKYRELGDSWFKRLIQEYLLEITD